MDREHSIREDGPPPDEEELAGLVEELEEVEEAVDSRRHRRAIRRTAWALDRLSGGRIFGVDDLAQQIVGGFILSAPFVVTEEVWSLAAAMSPLQTAIAVFMVLAIGYGTLYRAESREAEAEEDIAGVPLRFVSLIIIAYASVATLALVFDAPDTFGATPLSTLKAVCIGAIFSVVGAATADSLF